MEENFDSEKFQEYSKRIGDKLLDSKLKKKYEKALDTIQEIFEYPITVSVILNDDPENLDIIQTFSLKDYPEEIKNINLTDSDDYITLNDAIDLLQTEDNNGEYKLMIATKHLKPDAINKINSMIIVGMDDGIILVPKNDEVNEKN